MSGDPFLEKYIDAVTDDIMRDISGPWARPRDRIRAIVSEMSQPDYRPPTHEQIMRFLLYVKMHGQERTNE